MRTYTIFVEDDRYSVPTLAMIDTSSRARAEQVTLEKLTESPHHRAVELRLGDKLVYRRARSDDPGPSSIAAMAH